jgi:hypothetical protein
VPPVIKIWGILSGPIAVEDDEYPDDCNHLLICKAEVDGKMEQVHYWFDELEDANEWVSHFSKSIDPLELDYGDIYDA